MSNVEKFRLFGEKLCDFMKIHFMAKNIFLQNACRILSKAVLFIWQKGRYSSRGDKYPIFFRKSQNYLGQLRLMSKRQSIDYNFFFNSMLKFCIPLFLDFTIESGCFCQQIDAWNARLNTIIYLYLFDITVPFKNQVD